jgi:hypothetical protein
MKLSIWEESFSSFFSHVNKLQSLLERAKLSQSKPVTEQCSSAHSKADNFAANFMSSLVFEKHRKVAFYSTMTYLSTYPTTKPSIFYCSVVTIEVPVESKECLEAIGRSRLMLVSTQGVSYCRCYDATKINSPAIDFSETLRFFAKIGRRIGLVA